MKLFRQQFFSFTNVINNTNLFKNNISTPFTYIDNEIFIDIHHNNIFAVLITDPLNVFGVDVYYNKYDSLYETLQDAITGSNPVSIGQNNTDNVSVMFIYKTYAPYIAICSNNPNQIFIAPEKINYLLEYCNTCTVILGSYTIVFKLQTHPFYDLQSQYGPYFNLEYYFYSTTQPVSNQMNYIDKLNVEYDENNIVFTFTSQDWNGTVTIDLDDFNLSGTLTGTGTNNYDQDLTNVTTATFTFSNPIKPPSQIRVYLPNAVFSGNGNIQLGTIDEILTLDEELQCYISDELNIYNIPAKILLPLTLNTIASNKQLIKSGTNLKINNYETTLNNPLGEKSNYCNIDYNNYNGIFTVPYTQVDDVRMYLIYKAKEIDGYIAQRNIFLIDTNAHLVDTTEQQKINVHYAYFVNPAKEYFTLSSGVETFPNYVINPAYGFYQPWHPNINTFKHANFIIQADGGFISSIRIGAAPAAPTITINTNSIQQNAATLIIAGTGFNLELLDNIVTFNLGAEGIVTAATATELTVTFTTQPTSLGSLEVTLLMPLSSGAAVQVATVVTSITVTENLDSRAINAPTLVIAGTGFSATANQNTVAFNLGAVGTVTSATTTQLTITFLTQPNTTGSLTAVVTVSTSNGNSGNAVQVATTVAAPVLYASNNYYAQGQNLIIYGTGFDAVYPANNLVTFNLGAVGTVTSATTTQLTINFATLPNAENNLTAFVNSFGGDSNTEIVAVVLINDLLTYTEVEIAPPNYFIKTISGEGTFANPLSISTSRYNIDDDPPPHNELRELFFKISAAFPAGAILNWNGTWTHNSNYTLIYTTDRFFNPVPPPLYAPTLITILEELNNCGFGNAFQHSGSTTINKIYSVGPPDPYIAVIEVLSRKDMQTFNQPFNAPELVISLWITYE